MIRFFEEVSNAELSQAGGKASTLARLYQRGFPIPNGFIIFPTAFSGNELSESAEAQVQAALTRLRQQKPAMSLAIRSSGFSEDSDRASFAGEFETMLKVAHDDEVKNAIHTVRASRESARVQAYSQAQGLENSQELAVIVQEFIQPDFAGVIFTANPVTGNLMQMTGNVVQGVGEKLVSGESNAEVFSFDRVSGKYSGTNSLRGIARQLYRWSVRIDEESEAPQDIEWASVGNHVYILQARPITTLRPFNPATGEWNDSLSGDFLWANGNADEIQPAIMCLFTTSINRLWGHGYTAWWSTRYAASGCIGGRFYFNLTSQIAPFARLPFINPRKALAQVAIWWGKVPEDVSVPLMPFSWRDIFKKVIPVMLNNPKRMAEYRTHTPEFVAKTPAWCREMRQKIQASSDRGELAQLWVETIQPYYCWGTVMATASNSNLQVRLEAKLRNLIGAADANALISNLGGQDYLESLAPVIHLYRVARGEMLREEYLARYGHRSPNEFNPAYAQPSETPEWLDAQLASLIQNPVDIAAILNQQVANARDAWERLEKRHPRQAASVKKQLAEVAGLARQRELARSEIARVMGVIRAWVLRAGELTGLGEDIFHLLVEEIVAWLQGDETPRRYLAARRATFERYCALPPYPSIISGRFDPFQWASDPQRQRDVYDAHQTRAMATADISTVSGFAGAAGIVEGNVRVLESPEESYALLVGEILVTRSTNVGWTPLFPRAKAIITDVGAPLSHAAIVARELGIPAVVGCGNATTCLKTGMRVRVNGAQGIVEIIG